MSATIRRFTAVILLLALLALSACANGGNTAGGTQATVTTATPGTQAPVLSDAAQGLLYTALYDTSSAYSYTFEYLLHWECPTFDEEKFQLTELLYSYYGLFRSVNAKVTAQDTVRLFCSEFYDNIDTTDPKEVTDALLTCYVAAVGDVYGTYLSAEDYAEYEEGLTASYTGIGVSVVLTAEDGAIEVIAVFQGSPAEEAGLLPGDRIVAVGGRSVEELGGYYSAIAYVRGEEGTTVTVTMERDGEVFDRTITRAPVTEETVFSCMLDDGVGYIRLTGFDQQTFPQFQAVLETMEAQGARALLFDLRNNGGGLLTSIIDVLDYILPDEQPLAHVEYAYSALTNSYRTGDGHFIDLPMAVLVNEYTASAAELFAAALQDFARQELVDATVFGTVTFGKGTVQSLLPYGDGAALSLSSAYYRPPFSANYEGVGVIPDREVYLPADAQNKNVYLLTEEEDTQRSEALAHLLAALS